MEIIIVLVWLALTGLLWWMYKRFTLRLTERPWDSPTLIGVFDGVMDEV